MNILAAPRTSAPTPLAPPILCADSVRRSAPSAAISHGIRPAACTASTWSKPPARMHDGGGLRDRLHHAGLVVGEHQRHQRPRRFGDAAASAARSIRPSASTGMSSIASRGNRPPARTEECSIADIKSRVARPLLVRGLDRRRQRQHIGFGAARGEEHVAPAARRPARPPASRACSIRRRAARPSACTEDGLPGSASASRQRLRAPRPQRRGGVPIEIAALQPCSLCLLFGPRPVLEVATQCFRRPKHVASSKISNGLNTYVQPAGDVKRAF